MGVFSYQGVQFHDREAGHGAPFVFQHGLGGDVNQPFDFFQPPAGVRMLSLDCRAHGRTVGGSEPMMMAIDIFAADVVAWLDARGIASAVIGGISMGAAVAVNIALRWPDRVRGLVLCRPAWLDGPKPQNLQLHGIVADLLEQYGPTEAKVRLQATDAFQAVARQSPDAAASLVRQCEWPDLRAAINRLRYVPRSSPVSSAADYERINVPTLVLGSDDPVHPISCAHRLKELIAGAAYAALTRKSEDPVRHRADGQQAIEQFLQRIRAASHQ